MRINILDKTLEYENDRKVVEDIFKDIEDIVSKSNYIFSHLVIDGYEVYEDFNGHFIDNIRNINEVKVVTKTVKELSQDILMSTIDYIEGAIPEIEVLSNEFYKTPTKETWNKFVELIEGINWILETFTVIDMNEELKNIVSSYEKWNLYAKDIYTLKELMAELEEILENQDFISAADILSYEIVPLFNEMKENLEGLVCSEVDPNVLS